MKKIILPFIALLGYGATSYAQQRVGINVTSPQENLHVDSTIKVGKNTSIGTSTPGRKNLIKFGDGDYVTIGEEQVDDKLYIRYGDLIFFPAASAAGNGRIGIKTETPAADLDINGTFRLRGNGAAAGAVLTSDASGNATWQAPGGGSDIYNVGSTDFKGEGSDIPISVSGGTGGAYFTTAYYGNMVAPVHLPNGAKVSQIKIWYIDNSATENITFTFYGAYSNGGSYYPFAAVTTSGSSSGYRSAIITPSTPITIDNATFSYQVNGFAHWSGTYNMLTQSIQFTYSTQ